MQLPGMYPTLAGKIATSGPHNSVKALYKLKGLTSGQKNLLQKYERHLIATAPNPLLDPMRGRDPYRGDQFSRPAGAAF